MLQFIEFIKNDVIINDYGGFGSLSGFSGGGFSSGSFSSKFYINNKNVSNLNNFETFSVWVEA